MPKQAEVKAKVNVKNLQEQTQYRDGHTDALRVTHARTYRGREIWTWVLSRMEHEVGPAKLHC